MTSLIPPTVEIDLPPARALLTPRAARLLLRILKAAEQSEVEEKAA